MIMFSILLDNGGELTSSTTDLRLGHTKSTVGNSELIIISIEKMFSNKPHLGRLVKTILKQPGKGLFTDSQVKRPITAAFILSKL